MHFLPLQKAGWRALSKEGWRRESGETGSAGEKGEEKITVMKVIVFLKKEKKTQNQKNPQTLNSFIIPTG